MSLHSKIHAAQVLAAEAVVVKDLHDRGLCGGKCEFCLEALSESAARAAATPEQLLEHFIDWLLEQENINLPRAEQLKQLAREFLHEFLA